MKKIDRKTNYGWVRFLSFTAVLCLVSLWQFSVVRKELPGIIEWYVKDGYQFSEEQLQKLSDNAQMGFFVQAQQMVTDEILGRTEELTVRWADPEYFAWSGPRLELGDWPKGAGEAAVSYDWALEHYKRMDVAGQTIQIGDGEYQISGVYRTKTSWRQQLAGDGVQALYLSFQLGQLPKEHVMDRLYFAKEGGDFQWNQSYLQDVAASVTGMRVVPDISLDVESVAHVCLQNIVLCGILWLLSAAVFFGSFQSAGKKIAGYAVFILCAGCIIFYQWYIPLDYLPEENVFDIAGYIQRYIQGQNLRHLYRESGYFGNLAAVHMGISWSILLLEAVAAVCGMVVDTARKLKRWN